MKDQIAAANLLPIRAIDGIDQKLPTFGLPLNYPAETLLLPLRQVKFNFLGGKPSQFIITLKGNQHTLNLIPLQW